MKEFRISNLSESNPLMWWLAHSSVQDLERVSQILPRTPSGELEGKGDLILKAFTARATRALARAHHGQKFQRSDVE